jgi:hypothetical protein
MPITISGSGNISGLGTGLITQANMANNSVGSPQIISGSTIVTPNITSILSGTSGVLPLLKDSTGSLLSSFSTGSGYFTLPQGIIVQWGQVGMSTQSQTWTFPIAFPTGAFAVTGSLFWSGSNSYITLGGNPNTSKTSIIIQSTASGITAFMIAIGW